MKNLNLSTKIQANKGCAMLKTILLVLSLCFIFNNTTMAYPIILDKESLLQAKNESQSLGKYKNNDVRQYSYNLGEKGYGFLNKQAPIKIDIATPYSIARYNYYKESTIYEDFTDFEKEELIANANTIKVITRCNSMAGRVGFIPLPAKNVIIKKDDITYKSIPEETTNFYSEKRAWLFPIDIFDGKSDIEIIVIDMYDNVKPLKVKKEKLAEIK